MPAARQLELIARPEYLVLDTETTGVPKRYDAPVWHVENWPRVVQIAWLVFDGGGSMLGKESFIIRPEGFTIPADVVAIHHITTEIALRDGVPLRQAMDRLCNDLVQVSCVIAHNIEFDTPIICAEFHRLGLADPFIGKKTVCTMKDATDYCKLPGKMGSYKWPKLPELYQKLFGEYKEELHDAVSDAEMAAQCFWELMRRGVLG